MKRVLLTIAAALTLTAPAFSQQTVSDKDLATALWVIGQTMPEGFTLDLDTMSYPKEGLMVSYKATQDHFDRKSLPAVIKHAHAHENIIGGWRDPGTGRYYFDSTRSFPEDSLAAALAFARENGQHAVYVASTGATSLKKMDPTATHRPAFCHNTVRPYALGQGG